MKLKQLICLLTTLLIVISACQNSEKVIKVFGKTVDGITLVSIPLAHKYLTFSSTDAKSLDVNLRDIRGFYDEASGSLFLLESIDGFKSKGYHIVIIERSGCYKIA